MNENEGHIYTSRVPRKVILDMINKDFDNWIIKELPVIKDKEKKTNTFTYVFTIEKDSYEFID